MYVLCMGMYRCIGYSYMPPEKKPGWQWSKWTGTSRLGGYDIIGRYIYHRYMGIIGIWVCR